MLCTAPLNVASGSFGIVAPGVEGALARPPGAGRPNCENAGNPQNSKSRRVRPHERGRASITTAFPFEDARAEVKCNRRFENNTLRGPRQGNSLRLQWGTRPKECADKPKNSMAILVRKKFSNALPNYRLYGKGRLKPFLLRK
jgi:hypothetical protein